MSASGGKVNASMLDLFGIEVENHAAKMLDILLQGQTPDARQLEELMRSAHSIKGAAKLVNVNIAVSLAHVMEDCFVAAQNNAFQIQPDHIDTFLAGMDFIKKIAAMSADDIDNPSAATRENLQNLVTRMEAILRNQPSPATQPTPAGTTSDITAATPATAPVMQFNAPANIDPVMLDLFKTELEGNIETLSTGLLTLEEKPDDSKQLEKLMRASHSIKGAARLVGIDAVVKLAHAMEDCFVAAQNASIRINEASTDTFLKCIDLLKTISHLTSAEHAGWLQQNTQTLSTLIHTLDQIKAGKSIAQDAVKSKSGAVVSTPENQTNKVSEVAMQDAMVRVSATRINTLMGLAGELTVSSSWIRSFSKSVLGLKKKHNDLIDTINRLRSILESRHITELELDLLNNIQSRAETYREALTNQLIDIDDFDRRSMTLASRMNHEIISSRMRPFRDGIQGYKRMVRDIARSLNKRVTLEIRGEDTQVDREILEKIEAPINHMIRNAMDHGIEFPDERRASNKDETGKIVLEAKHNAGQLSITIEDDGRGVDIERLRRKVLERNLVSQAMAENLSKSELLDFLFLPAFSTRDEVTELSGRGVGLDVVHSTMQELRGKLHANTELGQGMKIHMELPLTLSVIRCLLVKLANELYAFPLAGINTLLKIRRTDISLLEDKQYITYGDKHVGLIHCAQILGFNSEQSGDEVPVVIIGDWNNLYGIVVDELVGERNLALRPLHSRLGKIKDLSAAALNDDGDPILILDVDDLIQSIRAIISGKDIIKVGFGGDQGQSVKRVLVVDDSLTVREVEKKLIESRGYAVDIAVDGVDAWNTVRSGEYSLVVTDVDMPRMNGIELVRLIKNDAALRNLPVMMVSYKDRPEDRQKGLEAGADYYLTKGSFHDETLIDAVRDLIGEATD
jgi:two-component system sensor histidine kinase and response regulator WspE